MATYYVNTAGSDTWDGLFERNITGTNGPVATLEQAITNASAGDTIRVASGTYTAPNTTGYVISKQLAIIGDPGVVLQRSDATSGPIIDIQVTGGTILQKVQLKNLKLKKQTAAASAVAGDYGIKCSLTGTASTILEWLSLEDIEVVGTSDSGFYFKAQTANNVSLVFADLVRCTADSTYGRGFYFEDGLNGGAAFVNVNMTTCYANGNQYEGIYPQNATILIQNSYMQGNSKNASVSSTYGGQLRLKSCTATLLANEYEDFTTASQTCKRGIVSVNSVGLTALGQRFTNASESADTSQRCYYLDYGAGGGTGPHHAFIGPSRVSNMTYFMEVVSGDTKVWAMEPFKQAGTRPTHVLTGSMHIQGWN